MCSRSDLAANANSVYWFGVMAGLLVGGHIADRRVLHQWTFRSCFEIPSLIWILFFNGWKLEFYNINLGIFDFLRIVFLRSSWTFNSLQKSFASISFRCGRKPVGIIGYIFFLLFGIVSSFSPSYTVFLVLRFLAAMFKTWKEVGGGIAGSVALIWDDNHYILS